MGPFALRSSDGTAKSFDGKFVRGAGGVVNYCKSGGALLVPPTDTTRVRGSLWRKDSGRGKVDVGVKLGSRTIERRDIRNVD